MGADAYVAGGVTESIEEREKKEQEKRDYQEKERKAKENPTAVSDWGKTVFGEFVPPQERKWISWSLIKKAYAETKDELTNLTERKEAFMVLPDNIKASIWDIYTEQWFQRLIIHTLKHEFSNISISQIESAIITPKIKIEKPRNNTVADGSWKTIEWLSTRTNAEIEREGEEYEIDYVSEDIELNKEFWVMVESKQSKQKKENLKNEKSSKKKKKTFLWLQESAQQSIVKWIASSIWISTDKKDDNNLPQRKKEKTIEKKTTKQEKKQLITPQSTTKENIKERLIQKDLKKNNWKNQLSEEKADERLKENKDNFDKNKNQAKELIFTDNKIKFYLEDWKEELKSWKEKKDNFEDIIYSGKEKNKKESLNPELMHVMENFIISTDTTDIDKTDVLEVQQALNDSFDIGISKALWSRPMEVYSELKIQKLQIQIHNAINPLVKFKYFLEIKDELGSAAAGAAKKMERLKLKSLKEKKEKLKQIAKEFHKLPDWKEKEIKRQLFLELKREIKKEEDNKKEERYKPEAGDIIAGGEKDVINESWKEKEIEVV